MAVVNTSVLWAQYMPLDVKEMRNRVRGDSIDVSKSITTDDKYSVDVSILGARNPSLFVVPAFSINVNPILSYWFKCVVTSAPDYGSRIGSRYERTGAYTGPKKPGDFSFLESFFKIKWNELSISLGKIATNKHNTDRHDILDNLQLPPVYGYTYTVSHSPFTYTQGHYWLGYSSTGDAVSGYSRYYATQNLKYSGNMFEVQLGDRVIYSGLDQPVNWRYLVPFEPTILSVFNRGSPRNNDNHIIDISLQYYASSRSSLNLKLLIDEFEVDSGDREINDDDWAYQLAYSYKVRSKYLTMIKLNHFYCSDYLGIHYGNSTNYEILGVPIFSEFGPQTKRTEIILYFNHRKPFVGGWLSLLRQAKGQNNIIGSPWQPRATPEMLSGWEESYGIESEIYWKVLNNTHLFIYCFADNVNKKLCKILLTYTF